MARPSNTDARRAQIADALLVVMASHGYESTSIQEIAKEAGLAPGLVHYHFRSKQEILLVALARLTEAHRGGLEAGLGQISEPRAALDYFLDYHLSTGKTAQPGRVATWILISAEALRTPEVQRPYGAALQTLAGRLQAILTQGVAQKKFEPVDIPAASAAIIALIQGYFLLAAAARSLIPPGTAASMAKTAAMGLVPPYLDKETVP